ncbi:MAG: DUF1573 domain-containing protein [Planctomycetota bacterium]|jgi:hypothetical protein
MRRNGLILTTLIVGCTLLLLIGCQEEAKTPEGPKTAPAEPKPVMGAKPLERDGQPSEPLGADVGPTRPELSKGGPKITFEKLVCDFGEVGPRKKSTGEFKFTNTGDALLKIRKVHKTCGCTVTKLDKKQYAPGENGKLGVTFTAGSYAGKAQKKVYVHSNDKANPRVGLTLKAMVAVKVTHTPRQLRLSEAKNANVPEITLVAVDGRPFAIKSFKAPGAGISADFDPSVKATKFVLEPRVNFEKLRKSRRGSLRIGLTHPHTSTVTIPFQLLSRYSITPPSLVIRNAEPQKPVRKKLWIRDNHGEDFEIESTSSRNGRIKVLSQEKVGDRHEFELEITPPPEGKKSSFTDLFFVNLREGEKLQVSCRGSYLRKTAKPSGR